MDQPWSCGGSRYEGEVKGSDVESQQMLAQKATIKSLKSFLEAGYSMPPSSASDNSEGIAIRDASERIYPSIISYAKR